MTKYNPSSKKLIASSIFGLLCFSGCALHVHNPYLAQTAQEAKKEMDEYSANAPKMYSAMLTNVEKFREEEEKLLTDMAENYHTALVTVLPSYSWKEIKDRIGSDTAQLKYFNNTIKVEALKYLKNKEKFAEDSKLGEELIKRFKNEIKDEETKVNMLNAYVAFLQTAFEDYPKLEESILKANTHNKIIQNAKKIGDTEIEYIKVDGSVGTMTVRVILEESKKLITNYDKELNLPEIEGQALSVLNLGLDLAEIGQKSATIRLARLEERKKIIENSISEVNIADKLITELKLDVNDECFIDGKTPYDDLQLLKGKYNAVPSNAAPPKVWVDSASETLLQLRKLAIAENILSRRQALLKVALAREDHIDSIIDSNIADQEWRTITSSGIESLVAFHEGGIKDEDVANLLQLAQSIGLAAIAAGVN